jgi:hypothetical protein
LGKEGKVREVFLDNDCTNVPRDSMVETKSKGCNAMPKTLAIKRIIFVEVKCRKLTMLYQQNMFYNNNKKLTSKNCQ